MDLDELRFLKEGLMDNGLSQEDYDTIEEMLENGDTWFDQPKWKYQTPIVRTGIHELRLK